MKEKIIIDGFDVSSCEYRTDTYKTLLADGAIKTFKNYCQICNDGCYAIDCYYKQLKRLEEKYNKMVEISKENLIKYEDLRLENEEFKNFVAGQMFYTDCENWLDRFIDYFNKWKKELIEENERLKEWQKADSIKAEKTSELGKKMLIYKQALEEIREIVSGNYETLDPQAKQKIQNIITETIGK